MRFALPDYFTTFWGENIRAQAVQHYENIGLNLTLNIGFPHQTHRDTARYCATNPSELFKNLYENIWKRNNNGVWVVNDANDFARYVHRLTQSYAGKVKYWEIWNAPGVDVSGNKGWKPRGAEDNWWDNNPEPCDLGIHAPIQHMVRMMRIAYEVIKSVDSNAVVVFSGAGYPSFLDAICRNTDNPENGSVKPNYPRISMRFRFNLFRMATGLWLFGMQILMVFDMKEILMLPQMASSIQKIVFKMS
jgi:hypothetical protein